MTSHAAPPPPETSPRTSRLAPRTAPVIKEDRPRTRRRALMTEWLPLSALFLAIGVFFTWPMPKRMSSGIYGFGNDNFGGIWSLEWAHKAFWGPETNDFSPMIQAPFGLEIDDRYMSPYDRLFTIVFGGINDALFAYNLEILLSFMAAGLTMYALARYLTGNRPAALVAGVIFSTSPFHLAMSMQYGAMATIQWAPLVVLAVVHALRTRRKRDAAWVGASVALMWLSSFYFGWFTIWWVGALVVVYALIGLVRAVRARRAAAAVKEGALYAVTRGPIAVVTSLVLAVPLLLPLINKVLTDPTQYARSSFDLQINAVRPWQFILPPGDHPVLGDLTNDVITRHLGVLPVYEQNVYLGVIPVVLALAAFVLARGALPFARAAIIPLVLASCFFVLLMLGPNIPYEVTSIGDWLSPERNPHWEGPVLWLYEISASFRYYGRAFVFVSVALSALAAIGLALLLRRFAGRRPTWVPWAIAGVLSLGVCFEFLNRPPNRFVDLSEPAWVDAVQKLPADASIVNYPIADYSSPRSLFYTYWQTRHEHPTANPPETPRSQNFLRTLDDPDSFLAGREMSEAGLDYAIVHTKLPPATFPPYQPKFADDSLPPSAGAKNPWLQRVGATSDAVIYKVRKTPTRVAGVAVGFAAGWGEEELEPGNRWRWMRNPDSELSVFAAKDYDRATLDLTVTSFNEPRTMSLSFDGRPLRKVQVPSGEAIRVRVPIRKLTEGAHTIKVSADPGQVMIDSVLNNNDLREVSLRLAQPKLTVPGE
jgi:hypothetical protein